MNYKRKVAVIGLDGLGRVYLKKMIESGYMPYLKNLVYRADVFVDLFCYPPVTPASWPSIMSGVDISWHGIYDFFKYEKPGKIRLFTALDLMHPRIHEMLGMNKIDSLVINPIPSYPIIPISNKVHVISSKLFFSPRPSAYPDLLKKYIPELNKTRYRHETYTDYIEDLRGEINVYLQIIEELAEKNNYHLIWINVSFPDEFLHLVSRSGIYSVLEKTIVEGEEKILILLDKLIRKLADMTENIIIVSDHGFKLYDKSISINTILYHHGYIVPTREKGLAYIGKEVFRPISKIEKSTKKNMLILKPDNKLVKIVRTLPLKPLRKVLIKMYAKLTGKTIKLSFQDVDPIRSKAYLLSSTSHGIIVNDLNRDEKEKIKEILLKYKGVKKVWLREELYKGPYTTMLPHIYLYLDYDSGYWFAGLELYDKIYRRRKTLDHYPLGLFIMKDLNKIKIKNSILNNTIVTPLIMAWLGVPISSYINDKEFITRIFDEKIKFTDRYIKLWLLQRKMFMMRRRRYNIK